MQRRLLLSLVILILAVAVTGCGDIRFSQEGYQRAILSGLKQIPEARQFDELFGKENVDHFISYHGSRKLGNEWQTEVFFGGRYTLTMVVPVQMGRSFDEVLKVLAEPTFYFREVQKVEDYSGQVGADFDTRSERQFGEKEWSAIYSAKGDFAAGGIEMKDRSPVARFEDYVRATRRDRIKVRR